ncbi:DUF4136 domain-containing protein [bacterium]|nr:MAG: DUF4136 domain-containing protein [bacterium]
MKYSKCNFGIICTGLFFLGLTLLSCTQPKEITYPTTSSWNGGFLFKFQNFGYGNVNPQSKSDPLFSNLQLQERIKKEIKFQFENQGLKLTSNSPDSYLFYYFLDDSLKAPVLPYQYGNLLPEQYSIDVDTLTGKQALFVMDLVDSGTMQLAWRAYAKITITPTDTLYKQLPLMIEAIVKRYPG